MKVLRKQSKAIIVFLIKQKLIIKPAKKEIQKRLQEYYRNLSEVEKKKLSLQQIKMPDVVRERRKEYEKLLLKKTKFDELFF